VGQNNGRGRAAAAMVGMFVFCLALASFYLGICVSGVCQSNIQPTTNHLANSISPSIIGR
jgi:hypothetical protein